MKKILLISLIIMQCIISVNFTVSASRGEYPVLPENLAQTAKEILNIDDTGSTLMYEKIPITSGFDAWMLGWFWDDYKIVAGITANGDIIYYNHSGLASNNVESFEVSKEEAYETAMQFINAVLKDKNIKLVSSNAYAYNFSEYYNGIKISGHDATVVINKYNGKVFYYKGFGAYDTSYAQMEKLVSGKYAYDAFFDNIGLELVYNTKYDDFKKTKVTKPTYIFNNLKNKVIDAQTGQVVNSRMYDYNYYYNDDFYNPLFAPNNNIKINEFTFSLSDTTESADFEEKIKSSFKSFQKGYAFSGTYGDAMYYFEKGNAQKSVPVCQVNIVPLKYKDGISRFVLMYDKNDYDWLSQVETDSEYVFARAYINCDTGEILDFTTVKNSNYTYSGDYTITKIPTKVSNFIYDAVPDSYKLKFFGENYVNDNTMTYIYARYENGIRVVGEGATVSYNKYTNDITEFHLNMSCEYFTLLQGLKSPAQMKELVKNQIPLELRYVDKNKHTKIPVYMPSDRNAQFDPVTGNRIDLVSTSSTTKIFICSLGSNEYNINGDLSSAPSPIYVDGKIYLPLRILADNLGYEVKWKENQIEVTSDSDIIDIFIGSTRCSVNGIIVNLDNEPLIYEDSTYLSPSCIGKIFGMQTIWDEQSNKIFIVN